MNLVYPTIASLAIIKVHIYMAKHNYLRNPCNLRFLMKRRKA